MTEQESPLLPKVQSLLLADHIWHGQGKSYIVGAFAVIHSRTFPFTYPHEIAIYATLTNIREDAEVALQITCLCHDSPLLGEPQPDAPPRAGIHYNIPKSADPNGVHMITLSIPAGAMRFTHAGAYVVELTVRGIAVGEYRFNVVQK
jgi:hypothetical protein